MSKFVHSIKHLLCVFLFLINYSTFSVEKENFIEEEKLVKQIISMDLLFPNMMNNADLVTYELKITSSKGTGAYREYKNASLMELYNLQKELSDIFKVGYETGYLAHEYEHDYDYTHPKREYYLYDYRKDMNYKRQVVAIYRYINYDLYLVEFVFRKYKNETGRYLDELHYTVSKSDYY